MTEQFALDPQISSALDELRSLIRGRYPEAEFEVIRDVDDPVAFHLTTIVDVEDPDEVLDVVIERLLELQIEEGLPVHVIPLQPLARLAGEIQGSISTSQRLLVDPPRL
jgi:hypothetical protein